MERLKLELVNFASEYRLIKS